MMQRNVNVEKRKTLRQQFANDFSSSAFRTVDGEQRIIGKFGQISQIGEDLFDVWFVGPDLTPLTEHKLTSIEKKIHEQGGFRRLTGEGYIQGRGQDFVLRIAPLCGIKKKRNSTPGFNGRLKKEKGQPLGEVTGLHFVEPDRVHDREYYQT